MAFTYRLFAPEIIQTSAMDCGPASLKCLLEGFGVRVSYPRLREACQTDVDGTCIDTLEEVAVELGLEAEQILIPPDHVLLPQARSLPAIVLTRQPSGAIHFVVVWRCHGAWVQVMDPATGRRWLPRQRFLEDLYVHRHVVAADDWCTWAGSEDFIAPLTRRILMLGASKSHARRLTCEALREPGWPALGTLDASARTVESMVSSGGVGRGREASRLHETLYRRAREAKPEGGPVASIPEAYWSARPAPPSASGTPRLLLRGAVLVAVRRGKKGRRRGPQDPPPRDPAKLSQGLAAALAEPEVRPARKLWQLLKADGLVRPSVLAASLSLAALAVVAQALLLRAPLDLLQVLHLPLHRLSALGTLAAFLGALSLLELYNHTGLLRLGRHLEARLRILLLEKIPRLGGGYLRTRLTSDMAERCHNIHQVRLLGRLGGQLVGSVGELLWTALGIIWLDPATAPLTLLLAGLAIAVPWSFKPAMTQRDLRLRSHNGALMRFYLDSLRGLVPIRSHSAQGALRREHESLLTQWTRAGLSFERTVVAAQALQLVVGFSLAAVLVVSSVSRGNHAGSVLVLVYWALNLPLLGHRIAAACAQYPQLRNTTLRLLEPLAGVEDAEAPTHGHPPQEDRVDSDAGPVGIDMRGVDVTTGGHPILRGIDLRLEPGSHVAVLGPSGAGKSSLAGLLLGWHRPARGQVLVDGVPLDQGLVEELRQTTAWVDPAVQLWNRTLLENLLYGARPETQEAVGEAVAASELASVLRRLPTGMQTPLGEAGARLSGGEGQRVRLARSLLKTGTRLVILDEAFRGLERPARRELLERCREVWRHATLVCITHDVAETLAFPRALVMDGGSIVEDGCPKQLLSQPGSRYGRLWAADEAAQDLAAGGEWRKLRLEAGVLVEEPGEARPDQSRRDLSRGNLSPFGPSHGHPSRSGVESRRSPEAKAG